MASQVQFCGWVDEAHKPALYALATAFLFPSLYEGFGMMVLEAMQAGTPVVTSRRVTQSVTTGSASSLTLSAARSRPALGQALDD